MRLKLYRELSAARCVNGIPMALIAAVHEGEGGEAVQQSASPV